MESDEFKDKALALFEKSLDFPSPERAEWIIEQSGENTALRDKALKYLSRDMVAGSAFHTGGAFHDALDDTAIPRQIGAYKVTGLIGRGGMGSVYRGERISGDFDHGVAIKVVRPGAMTDKLVGRFETERQTLARLSHPHIARLYDGGTLENGAPFIIMEYIDGLPITEWVETKALALNDRLSLFKSVCDAVSYAHQNLIIHRDITPSNILVDEAGRVKLIDFGIAKPFNKDSAITDTTYSLAGMSFTPGFAAPERSKGAGANTLSDIYSLGKLLEVLTKDLEPEPDLLAIIAKATASKPEDRYGSVDAFIDDLENYKQGFPVDAQVNSGTYRFGKFIKRHKLTSLLASAAMIGLLTAFGVTAYQYQRAETALVKADKRFNDVRKLATTMMNDIYDKIYRVPGSTEAAKELVQAAQVYLDELSLDKSSPIDVKREAAIGYTKLGTMVAGSKGGSITDLDASDTYFSKANLILEDLIKTETPDVETLTAYGKLYFYMAEVSISPRREIDLAWEQLQTSIAYLEDAIKIAPGIVEPKIALMYSNCYSAEILIQKRETEDAEKILRECVAYGDALLETYPDNENILRVKSASGRTLANSLSSRGNFSDAIPVLNVAISDLDKIETLVDSENDSFTLRGMTMAYWRRAYAYTNIEDYDSAIADYAKALEYTNKRLAKDPEDKDAIWFYYTIVAEQAAPLLKKGRNQQAEAGLVEALGWYEKRHLEQPENSSRLRNLFIHHYMMADFYGQIRSTEKECVNYKNAYNYFQKMKETDTLSQWDKDSLSELKKASVHCKITFVD